MESAPALIKTKTMKEKNGVLTGAEVLWDVALRGIGIQLPDEYVLRFCQLVHKANQISLDKIALSDMVEIETWARQELEKRVKED